MTDEKEDQPTGKLPPIKTKPAAAKPATHTVIAGFNFGCTEDDPEGTRVEPRLLTITLPSKVLADLLAQGVIVEVTSDGR